LVRAFGFRPNAWVCEVKSGLQIGEAKAFFSCHKNVIVASH
jgi:hypothetical protein